MGFYERYVFPWIIEQIDGPEIQELRARCVAAARGDVLEIGLGTGKTVSHYGSSVRTLTAIEPNCGMRRRLDARLATAPLPVRLVQASGESLPFQDAQFDSVVVSLVLCSVQQPERVLAEIWRVLRPGGRFCYFEHVASDNPKHRRWQDRLNWLQRWIGCGCNLNRETESAICAAGFQIEDNERRVSKDMPIQPEWFPLVRGVGVRPETATNAGREIRGKAEQSTPRTPS